MATVQVEVPSDLNAIAQVLNQMATQLVQGENFLSAMGGAMPLLFTESVNFDDIKKELKDPKTLIWVGLMIGGVAAKYGPTVYDKVKAKFAKNKKTVAANVPGVAGAQDVQ